MFVASYSVPSWLAPTSLFAILAVLTIGLLELIFGVRERDENGERLLFLAIMSFEPILLSFMVFQFRPVYLTRALLIVTPALIILLARALATTRLKSPLPYLYIVMVGIMLTSLFSYFTDATFAKPPFRTAAAYIIDHAQPGEAVIHTGNGSYLPFLFYLDRPDHFLLSGDPALIFPGRFIVPKREEKLARLN